MALQGDVYVDISICILLITKTEEERGKIVTSITNKKRTKRKKKKEKRKLENEITNKKTKLENENYQFVWNLRRVGERKVR